MPTSIGICLATFNGSKFLKAQLESIAEQSHSDWHLYVGDDRSTDETREILSDFRFEHPDKVTILPDQPERLGVNANFARIMKATEEDYIAFADQDDIWSLDKLANALIGLRKLESARASGQPAMVHADRRIIDAGGRQISRSYWASRGFRPSEFSFERNLGFGLAAGGAMLINRALLKLALPMPPEARMYDSWIELIAQAFGGVAALDDIALSYRRHGENTSGSASDGDSPRARRTSARAMRLFRQRSRQRKTYEEFFRQAEAFRRIHGAALDPDMSWRLSRFLSLPHRSWLDRLVTMLVYRISPPGLERLVAFSLLSGKTAQLEPAEKVPGLSEGKTA